MDEKKLRIGGRYNWIGQPERLVYICKNWSGNGYWHQFEKVGEPGVGWCEVTNDQLSSFEETTDLLTEGEISSLDTVAWLGYNGEPFKTRDLAMNTSERNPEELVRRPDAEAIIAGLQARIAELDKREKSAINMLHAAEDKVVSAKLRINELEAGSEPVCRVVEMSLSGKPTQDGIDWLIEPHVGMTLYAAPQQTDRNAVIDSCVNAILEKGALEDGDFVAAIRALKSNAEVIGAPTHGAQ